MFYQIFSVIGKALWYESSSIFNMDYFLSPFDSFIKGILKNLLCPYHSQKNMVLVEHYYLHSLLTIVNYSAIITQLFFFSKFPFQCLGDNDFNLKLLLSRWLFLLIRTKENMWPPPTFFFYCLCSIRVTHLSQHLGLFFFLFFLPFMLSCVFLRFVNCGWCLFCLLFLINGSCYTRMFISLLQWWSMQTKTFFAATITTVVMSLSGVTALRIIAQGWAAMFLFLCVCVCAIICHK